MAHPSENQKRQNFKLCHLHIVLTTQLSKTSSTLDTRYRDDVIYEQSLIAKWHSGNMSPQMLDFKEEKHFRPNWLNSDFMSCHYFRHSIIEVKCLPEKISAEIFLLLSWSIYWIYKFRTTFRGVAQTLLKSEFWKCHQFEDTLQVDGDLGWGKNMPQEFRSFLGVTHILTDCGIILHE